MVQVDAQSARPNRDHDMGLPELGLTVKWPGAAGLILLRKRQQPRLNRRRPPVEQPGRGEPGMNKADDGWPFEQLWNAAPPHSQELAQRLAAIENCGTAGVNRSPLRPRRSGRAGLVCSSVAIGPVINYNCTVTDVGMGCCSD